jgi:hypothetical protein
MSRGILNFLWKDAKNLFFKNGYDNKTCAGIAAQV